MKIKKTLLLTSLLTSTSVIAPLASITANVANTPILTSTSKNDDTNEEKTIITEGTDTYIANMDTICATEGDIVGKPTAGGDEKSWARSTFNLPITIGTSVTNIPDNFLYKCPSFNQPIVIPNTVKTIGNNFLALNTGPTGFGYNSAFNSTITFESNSTLESIGNGFLYCQGNYNKPITIPKSVKSIGSFFISQCSYTDPERNNSVFDSSVTFEDGSLLESIGDCFLANNWYRTGTSRPHYDYSFNQPITLPSNLKTIGKYFLRSDAAFNQPITIPDTVTSIGEGFMSECSAFNQPITIPSGVKRIQPYFLTGCNSFNSKITLSEGLTTISNNFLFGCTSFNQPLQIPSTVTKIWNNFMWNCSGFHNAIDFRLIQPMRLTDFGFKMEHFEVYVAKGTTDTWKKKLCWTEDSKWSITELE